MRGARSAMQADDVVETHVIAARKARRSALGDERASARPRGADRTPPARRKGLGPMIQV
ncbi:hypothetical protein PSP6_280151 [Paraburkholderia tropica]|nr:hypothetical protein PSP6_280151 [Paraburkholderia tropica]